VFENAHADVSHQDVNGQLPPHTKAAVVLLGDMPLIKASLIDTLVSAWRAMGEPAALVPTVNGQRGNPVVLSRDLEGLIEGLSGDAGRPSSGTSTRSMASA
jgi:molybdenum cofactor cytidylyltransferase